MSFKDFMKSVKDFVKRNWKEILGAIGAIGKVVLYIISKVEKLPSSYWLGLAFVFWLFIFIWALSTVKRAGPILRALAILAIIISVVSLGYFGTVGLVYCFATPPLAAGEVFKTESDSLILKGSGLTDIALNKRYPLTFSETADYVEAEFTVGVPQKRIVEELSFTYDDLPEYKGKLMKYGTTLGVKSVTQGFSVNIFLLAELTQEMPDPEINVTVEKKFARQNRWWRMKRWVFERYQD